MLLSPSQYLPKEEMKYSNYPDVYSILDKINQFQSKMEPVIAAVNDYDSGVADFIYVNVSDLITLRSLGFDITDFLGRSANVCYEVLLPVRDAIQSLNELIFSYQYEKSPVVLDKEKTNLQQINNVTNSSTITNIATS